MMALISFLQEVNIEEKVKNAPNNEYGIGIFIGSFVPFLVLVIIAYVIYRYNKNNSNIE
tara:strand:- start:470 stop:646 length:177 start_codon:yes stop_codon:yes gene_type:complete